MNKRENILLDALVEIKEIASISEGVAFYAMLAKRALDRYAESESHKKNNKQ